MFRPSLFGLAVSALIPSLTLQGPSSFTYAGALAGNQVILGDEGHSDWNPVKPPNIDDSDHLVFETAHSLLQHWPNTRMRNGHNIVPGTIPKGTLLYHVRHVDDQVPLGVDWVATDPEHSNVFCMDLIGSVQIIRKTCWLLTFATTRALKVIYFDGNSAANIPNGTADTQELLAWGKALGGHPRDELPMAQDLCKWGKNFSVGGFVRMEIDFEVVICDFNAGLQLVSSVNLKSRGPYRMFAPGFTPFEAADAGSWHNHFPGETRVQLDLTGLVSFYDTQLVPSLIPIRAGQKRWGHRIQNISSEDLSAAKSRLEAALTRQSGLSSGIDWKTLLQVVVDRFAGRLELTRHLLHSSAADPHDVHELANKVQLQLRIMLTPYIPLSAAPTDPSDNTSLDWTAPIYKLCATTHTSFMDSELDSMTESEKTLLRAVRGTSKEICRVLVKMWAAGVYAGLDVALNSTPSPDITKITHVWNAWETDLDGLMTWLDWSVWIKCDPRCGLEELCYLPTWPVGTIIGYPWSHPGKQTQTGVNMQGVVSERLAEDRWEIRETTPEDRRRPQPRCVSRFAALE